MKTAALQPSTTATRPKSSQPFFSKGSQATSSWGHNAQEATFFSPPIIQPKLTIGQPGDQYEQEADAMADQVVQRLSSPEAIQTKPMATPAITPLVQTKCAACEEEEKLQKKEDESKRLDDEIQLKPIFESNAPLPEEGLQRKCVACEEGEVVQPKGGDNSSSTTLPSIESSLASTKGSGNPLPEGTRQQMESSFGADFSGVRVHTDSSAVQMNKELRAHAFAHGSDIYFNAGKFNPNHTNGQRLLAHELTHTVQQKGGAGPSQRKIQRWPDWVSDAAGWVSDTASDAAGSVVEGAEWVGGQVADGAQWVGGKVAAGAEWAGEQISAAGQWIIDGIRSGINSGTNYLNERWESIQQFGSTCFDDIKDGFGGLINLVTTPLSSFMSALSLMNADMLGSVWNLLKSGSDALWTGINSVINGVLQLGQGIWNTVSGFITGIFDTIDGLFDNSAFDLLPDWIKDEVRSLFNSLRALWNNISTFWTDLWQRLTSTVQEILAAVQSFVANIINFGIDSVLSMARNLKEAYDFVTEFFSDPQATIQPFLDQIAGKLNSEVPLRANTIGTQLALENYSGRSTQSAANGTIQREAIDSEERDTASLNEVAEGIFYYIAQAWPGLDGIKKMLWETVVNMFWPPATIEAISNQFSQLWNDDWATTVDSLYTPRNFFDDPIGCLHDIWSNFLILLDFPLALFRTLNNVIGLLMGYVTLIVVLAEAGGAAVAAGLASGGAAAIPAFFAGALTGLATMAPIGIALMDFVLAAESATVIVNLVRLYTARQTCEKRQVDILTSVSSFIAMGVALVLQFLMALLAQLVTLIKNATISVPQPAVPQPAVPQPAVPQPAVPQPAVPQPAVPQPNVIPFPIRPAPVTPAVPLPIAAKFEEGVSQIPFSEAIPEGDKSSDELTNGSYTIQESNPDTKSISLSGVLKSTSGTIQTSRKDRINPDVCEEEKCKAIVVPNFVPQYLGSNGTGEISGSLAQGITQARESAGFRKLTNYYGNNIAGFMYEIFENESSTTSMSKGMVVRRNTSVHSEEQIIAELDALKRTLPPSHVIRVKQIGTERSACSNCYGLIRNNGILTARKIYTQGSAIYFIVRYDPGNRVKNAKALKERYCGFNTSGG